jgi:phosphoenolpyruvate---glycerone phosphotransferase subunit DhaK
MKKFINRPDRFVDEMLEGVLAAHPHQLAIVGGDLRCIVTARPKPGKVGIASGGGSGHLPLFLGYVGDGVLDGAAVGGVFQSPSAEQMLEVTKAIHQGAGVLYVYGNYSGDVINFDMAAEMAGMDGIKVLSLVGNDDVASAPKGEEGKRRGVAGMFFVFKAAGAAAAAGASLEDVLRVAERANSNIRTMGVALTPCIIPEVGHPSFTLGENEMEIGMGVHGEPGVRRGALLPADAVVDEMLTPILADLPFKSGDEVAVLMNGLGGTPKEELYVMYRRVHQLLEGKGISAWHVWVGEFVTSMEMAGLSISLLRLDPELKKLLAAPAMTPFFQQAAIPESWTAR